MILSTERLMLREMTQDDFPALCRILQDERVMTAYEHAFSDSEVQEWLDRQRSRYQTDGIGLWAVLRRETGEMIGQAGLTIQDCDGKKVTEIGYLLAYHAWHQGFATEAAIGCRQYAFDTLKKDEVYSIIRDNNYPSQKVALRNGMVKIGEFVKYYHGIYMPHWIYWVQNPFASN